MEHAAPKKIGKFRASYLLATESFELFSKDKEIVWFVVWNIFWVFLAGFAYALAAFGLLWSEIITLPQEGEPASALLQLAGYGGLFLLYLVVAYITTFYGVALTSVVSARLEGEDKGFKDGIDAANARSGKILGWSLLSSTVGVLLQFLSDRASWAAKLVSFLGGAAWGVATFFIIPVLAREEKDVKGSVGRSAEIFTKTWGETIIMNFSLGLFFGALHIVLLVLAFVVGALLFENLFALGLLIILYVIVFVVVAVLQSVLEAMFKVVLYEYATRGTVPASFTPELIMSALKKKEIPAATSNG